MYLSRPILSQDSKNIICFDVRQTKIRKIAFHKFDVITFTWFSAIAQPQIKVFPLSLFTPVVDAHVYTIHSGFWLASKK